MRRQLLFALIIAFSVKSEAQNHLDIRAGFSYMQCQEWNQTIAAYNFSRPWLIEEQPEIHSGFNVGLSYSGVIAKGLFLTPNLSHQLIKSFSSGKHGINSIEMRWMTAGMSLDIYPLEFGLDSVSFNFRPFARIGAGAAGILPRVIINDSLAYARDEVYDPIIWNLVINAGVGCRIRLTDFIDFTPSIMWNYYPGTDLEGFATALHGTLQPELSDKSNIHNFWFSGAVSFRVGKKRYPLK